MMELSEQKLIPEDQYELQVIQHIIDQLNIHSENLQVKEILNIINGNFKINLGILRTKIATLYHTENTEADEFNPLFYNSLFSFLLLLAKYAPTNFLEKNQPVCGISQNVIRPDNRILTTSGQQFEKTIDLRKWINQNNRNPCTNLPLSNREKSYIDKTFDDQENKHEIPFPEEAAPLLIQHHIQDRQHDLPYPIPRRPLTVKKMIGIMVAFPIFIILETLALSALFMGVIAIQIYFPEPMLAITMLCPVLGALTLCGHALASFVGATIIRGVENGLEKLEKKIISLKHHYFSAPAHNTPNEMISPLARYFFSFLKNASTHFLEEKPLPIHSTQHIQQGLAAQPSPKLFVAQSDISLPAVIPKIENSIHESEDKGEQKLKCNIM